MIWALILAIVLLQAFDVATTVKALNAGAEEINPFARRIFGWLGPLAASIILKLIFTAPMIAFAIFYPRWWPVPAIYAASLVWVVWHNLRELRLQREGAASVTDVRA